MGALSAGHARALLNAADPAGLAREIVRRGLNVRQTERLAQAGKAARRSAAPVKDADTVALERDLANLLGLKVTVSFAARGGALTIHYRTLEQLDDVLRRLHHTPAVSAN
jgi:ParB family chromosome partitioning protein